jgi:hypothetical protein
LSVRGYQPSLRNIADFYVVKEMGCPNGQSIIFFL